MMESWRAAFSVLHQASLKEDSLAGLPLIILTRENINEDERRNRQACCTFRVMRDKRLLFTVATLFSLNALTVDRWHQGCSGCPASWAPVAVTGTGGPT